MTKEFNDGLERLLGEALQLTREEEEPLPTSSKTPPLAGSEASLPVGSEASPLTHPGPEKGAGLEESMGEDFARGDLSAPRVEERVRLEEEQARLEEEQARLEEKWTGLGESTEADEEPLPAPVREQLEDLLDALAASPQAWISEKKLSPPRLIAGKKHSTAGGEEEKTEYSREATPLVVVEEVVWGEVPLLPESSPPCIDEPQGETFGALWQLPSWTRPEGGVELPVAAAELQEETTFDFAAAGYPGKIECQLLLERGSGVQGMLTVRWQADHVPPQGWWIALSLPHQTTPIFADLLGREEQGEAVFPAVLLGFDPLTSSFRYVVYPR